MQKRNSAFTLVEMLIVIVVIWVLATALIPKIQSSLARTRNSKRVVDLRTVYNGLKTYITDFGSFPVQANKLAGSYLTSLPADPSWLESCVNKKFWPKYGSVLVQEFLPTFKVIDANNYYDWDKWYYYNNLATWTFVPWRWVWWWGTTNVNLEPIAIIGAYMEKVGNVVPVSNVPYSAEKHINAYNGQWRASGCPEYAIWSLYSGIWAWTNWYAASSNSVRQLADPEAINTPELTARLDIIMQDWWNGLVQSAPGMWSASISTMRYDTTEWDYIMMITR